ncbi:hypothetical protein ASD76_08325 [Altererythrobacter sp. Root672]|nr:hypothetical protein ASD76_08325 [Altererythrobacter sp. Root672]
MFEAASMRHQFGGKMERYRADLLDSRGRSIAFVELSAAGHRDAAQQAATRLPTWPGVTLLLSELSPN